MGKSGFGKKKQSPVWTKDNEYIYSTQDGHWALTRYKDSMQKCTTENPQHYYKDSVKHNGQPPAYKAPGTWNGDNGQYQKPEPGMTVCDPDMTLTLHFVGLDGDEGFATIKYWNLAREMGAYVSADLTNSVAELRATLAKELPGQPILLRHEDGRILDDDMVLGDMLGAVGSGAGGYGGALSPKTADEYVQDGPVAREIASVIPYYKYKGIERFYDINGFLTRPDVLQMVVDVLAARYKSIGIDSIGGFDARGFGIGPSLALALKVPFFMLRKAGKMSNAVGSAAYKVEYGKRDGMCIPRGMPLDKTDPSKKSTVVKSGDRVLLVDDLVATGGTLSSGIELVRAMGGTVVECACIVELKLFIDPPAESGLPSRTKAWTEKGIIDCPVWGLISEDVLTLKGEVPDDYVDDGEEH